MRHHVALAVLAASALAGCPKSTPSGPSEGDSLTLPLTARAVGTKWSKVDDTSTTVEITIEGQTTKAGGRRHHRTDGEILAVDAAGLVTKVALSYVERTDTDLGPGGEETRPSAIAGKSYIVWVEGGEVAATHADGGAVSSEELLELTTDQEDLGKPPVMEQIMARTWKRGVKVDLTADELARVNEGKDGPRSTSMSFTLRGVTGGVADFAMSMRMENLNPPIAIDASGTATVDARTGRPVKLEISGPVSGSANGLPLGGSMTGHVTYTFTGP